MLAAFNGISQGSHTQHLRGRIRTHATIRIRTQPRDDSRSFTLTDGRFHPPHPLSHLFRTTGWL
jgi:hypothetical protein